MCAKKKRPVKRVCVLLSVTCRRGLRRRRLVAAKSRRRKPLSGFRDARSTEKSKTCKVQSAKAAAPKTAPTESSLRATTTKTQTTSWITQSSTRPSSSSRRTEEKERLKSKPTTPHAAATPRAKFYPQWRNTGGSESIRMPATRTSPTRTASDSRQ